MKTIVKIGFLFCISSGVLAQTNFNTVRFKVSIKEETMILDTLQKAPQKKQMPPKKTSWWKHLFGRKNKPDLNKQIDSLKTLIIKNKQKHKKTIDKIKFALEQVVKKELTKVSKLRKTKPHKAIKKICTPLKEMFITSPFGKRLHPIDKEIKMHNGIDLKATYERVYAVMDGQIIETGFDTNKGRYIRILHSDKFETWYFHLSEIYYQKGEKVKAGFIIAKSGNTGTSTNPHLHFAVKDNGKFINPTTFLNQLIEINNIINMNKYGTK